MLIIPIFVPHAGCPNDCCFCNQKIISGNTSVPDKASVVETILFYEKIAYRYDEVQIAFYGGSFTAIESSLQEMFLEAVQPFLKTNGGFIDCIRASTRPDCIDETVIGRLKKYNVSIIELGAQSMDDKVLEMSKRGHNSDATRRAAKLLKEAGITLGLQTMTGLPGATAESDKRTACEVAKLEPDLVRIYPTIVIKNTDLCEWFLRGEYTSPTLEETVELCADLFEFYDSRNITVIRMGLQSSDNISDGGDIASGPYHPAFGQLVKSRIALRKLVGAIEATIYTETQGKELCVNIPTGKCSDYTGQKKYNSEYIKNKFGFSAVKFYEQDYCKDFPEVFIRQ
ncbi:MAG: radical SAM protein [Ruminococcaceae bacterium]|nr:radical SAM protein [Oscillospiraceae bacterium]